MGDVVIDKKLYLRCKQSTAEKRNIEIARGGHIEVFVKMDEHIDAAFVETLGVAASTDQIAEIAAAKILHKDKTIIGIGCEDFRRREAKCPQGFIDHDKFGRVLVGVGIHKYGTLIFI